MKEARLKGVDTWMQYADIDFLLWNGNNKQYNELKGKVFSNFMANLLYLLRSVQQSMPKIWSKISSEILVKQNILFCAFELCTLHKLVGEIDTC